MANPKYIVDCNRRTQFGKQEDGKLTIPFGRDSSIFDSTINFIRYSKDLKASEVARDIMDVATAVMYADRYCPRAMREEWIRDIDINISLREPEAFLAIQHLLEFCLSAVGGDNIRFTVSKMSKGDYDPPIAFKQKRRRKKAPYVRPNFCCVALLSGGQDSTAGAISLIESGRTPIFVRVNTMDKAKAKDIHKSLWGIKRNRSIILPQQVPSLSSNEEEILNSEDSQRLRSFYFLSLAALTANLNGVNEVYINENGIMGIHLPLDISRSSTFSTRTAYPLFIYLFQDLMRSWLKQDKFVVLNLWALKTKAQVISSITNQSGKHLLSKVTRSCAHAARVGLTASNTAKSSYLIDGSAIDDHCGYCFPCILRRISMHSAGMEDVSYLTNPFKLIFFSRYGKFDQVAEAASAVFSLIGFYILFTKKTDTELIGNYPQILECAAILNVDAKVVIDLHREFCREVEKYIKEKEPNLFYLLDEKKSMETENSIVKLANPSNLDAVIKELGVGSYNEHFEKKVEATFNDVRLFIQTGIANNLTSEDSVLDELKTAITEVIPRDAKGRKDRQLNNTDGNNVRSGIKEKCKDGKCYPLRRKTSA